MDSLQNTAFDKNTEIIASFFTNRCYNDIYGIAKNLYTQHGGQSLTMMYAQALTAHLNDFEISKPGADSVIRETIKDLHKYYCSFLGTITLEEFVMCVISQIIPKEFLSAMGAREKDGVLRDLVRQTALAIMHRALKEDMLHRIIDCRGDKVGVGILRDLGIKILHDFRSSFISKLYSKPSDKPNRSIDGELFDRVRAELGETLKRNIETEAKYRKLSAQYAKLAAEYNKVIQANKKLAQELHAVQESRAPMAPADQVRAQMLAIPSPSTQTPSITSPVPAPSATATTTTIAPAPSFTSLDTPQRSTRTVTRKPAPSLEPFNPSFSPIALAAASVAPAVASATIPSETKETKEAKDAKDAKKETPPNPPGSDFDDCGDSNVGEDAGEVGDEEGSGSGSGSDDDQPHVNVAQLAQAIVRKKSKS